MSTPRSAATASPLYRQYRRIKARYPDALLLFRLGDFYETFEEDAAVAARELEIVLTSREMGKGRRMPMAGIPAHALEGYLARLIRKGHKVAICEQLTEPGQGLVERDVVRVVTPGTVVEPFLLDQKANNYLAALVVEGDAAGLAYVDVSTTDFATTQLSLAQVAAELDRLGAAELLVPEGQEQPSPHGTVVTTLDARVFHPDEARERLMSHLGVASLEGYGCEHLPLAIAAAGAVLEYLGRTHKEALAQLTSLRSYDLSGFMVLDPQTRRNLELFDGGRWGGAEASLLRVLDMTRTAMGGRLLRSWLGQPLRDLAQLERRLDLVDAFFQDGPLRQRLREALGPLGDMQRLVARIGRHNHPLPREVVALRGALERLPGLRTLLLGHPSDALQEMGQGVHPCEETASLIATALVDDPPPSLAEGGVIRDGFSAELDQLRAGARSAREYIAGLEKRERERTGLRSLKVGYNRVFGYYLEVSRANLAAVPADYLRRQTLVNGERFITPELKEQESLVLNATEQMAELETALFRQVCQQVGQAAPALLETASVVAQVDVLAALAEAAYRYGYTRPRLNEGAAIAIAEGRHPVVERHLPPGSFVPNDTHLANDDAQLVVLTGPNMSGKSTYIRQVAIIVLMAQVGSFVPAREATIGLVDRIFTRVGLQDDLTTGQSTFMVEMAETANILNHATSRSLVILDEIGRGTSTYDGLAIAQAVAEYLHNHPRLGCKTLFATHYHELTALARYLPRARNFHVEVAEEEGNVVFLHRIVPGSADRSYGIHVAQLAGLPRALIHRAWELLAELEGADGVKPSPKPVRGRAPARRDQLALGGVALQQLRDELVGADLNGLTPLEALNLLYRLQQRAKESGW